VTVLDSSTLHAAGEQHFADVLSLVPNLNWAGGTSRPRYFQIRGIGEREQYEGAPNPSVGFLIDDIDFSGIGMAATLFDVSQVEVLRGPQGTRYGANALAGLISVRSAEPSDQFGASVQASAADYGTGSLGAVITGPVESLDSAWRLAVQQYRSDGFRDDAYLGRDDTNDRDELTARFKWNWRPNDSTRVDFTFLHADIDNGYDAWSIDNTWHSQSDRPGKDSQKANAGSVRLTTSAWGSNTLTAIGAYGQSKGLNSYDADWGNAQLWAPYTYDYFEAYTRDRDTGSLELRLASAPAAHAGDIAWLVGAYGLRLTEDGHDDRDGIYEDPFFPDFNGALDDVLDSDYHATNRAVFAQLDGRISERLSWSTGVRTEERRSHYRDGGIADGLPRDTDLRSSDTMLGGQASLSYDLTERSTVYASASRGYKAGGFNLGPITPDRQQFEPEYLWNFEVGTKQSRFDGRLYADASLFYSRRRDVQILNNYQSDPIGNPTSFTFFTDNASGGYNYGLESSLRWRVTEIWDVGGSVGLLRTRYQDYVQDGVALADREQAHAPKYQVALNAGFHLPSGWNARADVSAVDAFYFDVPPNDTRSDSYTVTNLRAGYDASNWTAYLWARNLFNETYAIRGFFFGNVPPEFPSQQFIQRGDPRQVGVTFTYSFR
jgi:outer membrane receptor protein involved in Fe transport